MKTMNDRLREMIEDCKGEALRPARITRCTPQEDGSVLRQIFNADGECVLEQIIPEKQFNLWQIEAIEEGVKEADAGNFATDEEVVEAFTKYCPQLTTKN